ncbi:MAG: GTPase Era [Verrucomicrobiae bacterium]|nr:GTPase Era [Verrucomicrobiae bacterium]
MSSSPNAAFRAGLAALIGRTNVGKSTLLNALVDSKIAIVSPKPQTTRHPVHGVVHRPQGQLVLVDTPGFFKTHASALVDRLHHRARTALDGIDLVIHVVDPSRPPGPEETMVLDTLAHCPQPRVLCLNKSDLRERPHRDAWIARAGEYSALAEVSAIARRGIEPLIDTLLALLPPGEPLYPPSDLTNAHRDFRIAECIREKIYLLTGEEVPYRTAVRLDATDTEQREPPAKPRTRITATILVANDRYKAMLIGAGGQMVKKIRAAARGDLQRLIGTPVALDLNVRTDAHLPE